MSACKPEESSRAERGKRKKHKKPTGFEEWVKYWHFIIFKLYLENAQAQ